MNCGLNPRAGNGCSKIIKSCAYTSLRTLFGKKYDPAELIPGLNTRVEHSAVDAIHNGGLKTKQHDFWGN